MQQRASEGEFVGETILRVKSEQGLALHGEHRLILKCDAYIGAGVDDALVGDGDYAHAVVDGIVGVLHKCGAAGCDHNRPSRHIHGV